MPASPLTRAIDPAPPIAASSHSVRSSRYLSRSSSCIAREHTAVSCVNVPMEGSWNGRRWRIWAVRTLGGVAALVVVLLAALLLVQAHLKDPLVRYVAAQSQRQIRVDGAFQANILSLHPRISAENVVYRKSALDASWPDGGNRSPGADVRRCCRIFVCAPLLWSARRCTWRGGRTGIPTGRFRPPGSGRGTGPPLIHSLRMPNARVFYDDARRRLKFDGTMTAQDLPRGRPDCALADRGGGAAQRPHGQLCTQL